MPKVSVITINLNNKAGLLRTVTSVITQSFQDYELIVIDGGSADGSTEIINDFSDKLAYWVSEKDNGIYHAMNKGIIQAKGDYLFFLNSGDVFYNPDVLQKVFQYSSAIGIGIIYGDIMLSKDDNLTKVKTYPDKLSHYYLLTDNVAHQSQFILRSLFLKYGSFDTKYKIVADFELFIRFVYLYHVTTVHIPEIITIYNLDGVSAAKEHISQILAERKKVQQQYMPSHLVWIYQKYADFLQSKIYRNRFVASLTVGIRNIVFCFIKPRTH